MSNLLNNDNIIMNGSTRNKTTLFKPNKFVNNHFKTIGKNFSNNLVRNIAERYWEKISNTPRVIFFGNLDSIGSTLGFRHRGCMKEMQTALHR